MVFSFKVEKYVCDLLTRIDEFTLCNRQYIPVSILAWNLLATKTLDLCNLLFDQRIVLETLINLAAGNDVNWFEFPSAREIITHIMTKIISNCINKHTKSLMENMGNLLLILNQWNPGFPLLLKCQTPSFWNFSLGPLWWEASVVAALTVSLMLPNSTSCLFLIRMWIFTC